MTHSAAPYPEGDRMTREYVGRHAIDRFTLYPTQRHFFPAFCAVLLAGAVCGIFGTLAITGRESPFSAKPQPVPSPVTTQGWLECPGPEESNGPDRRSGMDDVPLTSGRTVEPGEQREGGGDGSRSGGVRGEELLPELEPSKLKDGKQSGVYRPHPRGGPRERPGARDDDRIPPGHLKKLYPRVRKAPSLLIQPGIPEVRGHDGKG